MRNTLPATCERPTPSDRLYFAYAYLSAQNTFSDGNVLAE